MKTNTLTGRKIGRLTVGRIVGRTANRSLLYECHCDCRNVVNVSSKCLLGKKTKTRSCGCLRSEWCRSGEANKKHGLSKTPEYIAWIDMQTRCSPGYKNHGDYFDRGIKVSEAWLGLKGLHRFIAHIGKRPSSNYSLDRKNNNAGYEPGNIRWATRKEQIANRRKTLRIDQFTTQELLDELNRRKH